MTKSAGRAPSVLFPPLLLALYRSFGSIQHENLKCNSLETLHNCGVAKPGTPLVCNGYSRGICKMGLFS